MPDTVLISSLPISDEVLRDLAKNVAKTLPIFAEKEPAAGVKKLQQIIIPVLETADLPDLENSHRAAASNALCAIIEHCAASDVDYVREAILNDAIWFRVFGIYLQRSGDAKGKSMRQMLLVLTDVITKDQSRRAVKLRERATSSFLDIICEREDRIKVKPALQGLAHFLLRDVVSLAQLVELFAELIKRSSKTTPGPVTSQTMFKRFLAWVVHHDTALSAGHVIKNFLIRARRLPTYGDQTDEQVVLPLWIEPVVQTLHEWPDRIQEFKTHVFPHCFQPAISEYMRFLAYLHFDLHVPHSGLLPNQLHNSDNHGCPLDGPEEFRLLLAAIATGKELTIVKDNTDTETQNCIEIRDGALYLPNDVPGNWMSNPEADVRLAGMFLSVYSTSVTKPVSGGVLRALRRNLVHLHTDTDANFRREVHGYTQKLFDRLRASTATLSKSKSKSGAVLQSRLTFPRTTLSLERSLLDHLKRDPLLESLSFIAWYIRFLEWELRPTASYQSRITALRSLTIVLRSGIDPGVPFASLSKSAQGQLNWAHAIQIGSTKLIRMLLDLILDPFDDIRDVSVSVLQLCLIALPQAEKERAMSMIPRFLARAETTMLRTGRADQADGVARAYGMLFALTNSEWVESTNTQFSSKLGLFEHLKTQLQDTLDVAHSDLSRAVDGRPVHGTFAALRYVVDRDEFYPLLASAPQDVFARWKRLHSDVVANVESLWSCVYHVLCADAPEGHVPDELEDEGSLDTKEILSYSWRGLKEASVLLRTLISKAPVGDGDRDLITPELFEKLGRLCFEQLLDLRHRGAFSTVSQTFAVFCRRCVSSNILLLRALPETWYQETLRSIQVKSGAITRRSAGIPAAMSALLAAEPQAGGKLFPRAMKDLVAETLVEAQSVNIEESRLPQVHALNCIKEIFTTSKLSVASEAYVGQGLELAAKTLNSPIWPLRNCSLMLFKALIERLLGSDEAQDWKERDRAKTSRFSYDNYPSLAKILTDLLEPNGVLQMSSTSEGSGSPLNLHGAEGVFPALQILRQARPPGNISTIRGLVEKLLSSPHWHMRDMAARTYVSLRATNDCYHAVSSILDPTSVSSNERHGRLLVAKYLLKKLLGDSAQTDGGRIALLMQKIVKIAQDCYVPSKCPFVRAAIIDVVSLCGVTMLRRPDAISELLHHWQTLTAQVSIGPKYNLGSSNTQGDALFQTSLAQLFFVDRVVLRENTGVNTLKLMLSDEYQGIDDALMLLAIEDPDTCCATLETLDTILHLRPSNGLTIPLSLVLAHIHRIILEATDHEVLSKAQAVLASSLADMYFRTDFFNLITEEQAMLTLSKLETQCLSAPPSNMQSALHLLGFFLDHAYTSYHKRAREILQAIARYVRLLRMTTKDTNPFNTRLSAMQSLSTLQNIFTMNPQSPKTSPLLLALLCILYDLLTDDDDEIRDQAAQTTGTLLRAQGQKTYKNTVPILTTHHLASYLTTTFAHSPHLAKEAIRRLTNTPQHDHIPPFSQTFEKASEQDPSLFAAEKQNQYKDDTLDAKLWSRILAHTSLPSRLRTELADWVHDGLSVLSQTAEKEEDGALGWSSKSEVFALGFRVFCAAQVLLRHGGERERVLVALGRFLDVADRRGASGVWCEVVVCVVEKEVLGRLERVMVGLDALVRV
ncbi:hypothetical protein BDW02DRAFT_505741 [Decorospora gaudefroyi]|uniref:Uncharacterized protein n=1 Tax=Decorospora gaudefroyi TaxID=184978 RepID=A0A6A5KD01_9PLEO|nr:hypothetical protein BDW02DRAFT_505741 [Decorospora gaudefroyi]